MGLLDGKKAFVTGGSRGIGRAICEVFAREGADVAFNYSSRQDAALEVEEVIRSYGRQALSFQVSVTDGPALKNVAKEVMRAFGQIDILVNNAAINKADSFATTTEESWRNIVEVNVNGLYYVTKPFFRHMMRRRSGNILNITSIAAVRALPTSVHYATTKAAVLGFTKCLSREAAPFNIPVNGIAAGIFDTDLGHSLPDTFTKLYENWCPKNRLGNPTELAEFAAFMASDRNSYMTGETVVIDGGATV